MTYQEMQERLTKVETLIQAVQQPRYQNKVQNVQETLTQLNTIKENLENKMKILAEAEGTITTDDEAQAEKLARKGHNVNLKEDIDGGQLFDYFAKQEYDVKERRPDGYPPKEGVEGYQVSRGNDRYPQIVIFQYNTNNDQFTISRMSGYRIDEKEAEKAGMKIKGKSGAAGMDSYMTDGNYTPVDISAEGLKDIVDHVMSGLDREGEAQGDFYRNRLDVDESIKEGEGDDHHYVKIPRLEFRDANRIVKDYVNTFNKDNKVYDNDEKALDFGINGPATGDDVYTFYFDFDDKYIANGAAEAFIADLTGELSANGVMVIESSVELDEAVDHNDPALIRARAARAKAAKKKAAQPKKSINPNYKRVKNAQKIAALKEKRAQLMRDMEQEAEPEGGPIADKYGAELEKIDKEIAKLSGQKTMTYHQAIAEDQVDSGEEYNPEDDPDYEEWAHPNIGGQPLDGKKNEHHDEAGMEVPADDHDDLDIGHQDDEPHMLKKDVYDIAVYAAKLYKQLKKYDAMENEVDFPHWWQRKVTLAREYMSKAQHYLEFEEKEPMIDQLALEGKYKSDAQRKAIYATKAEKGELEEDTEEPTSKDIKKGEKDSIVKQAKEEQIKAAMRAFVQRMKDEDILDPDGRPLDIEKYKDKLKDIKKDLEIKEARPSGFGTGQGRSKTIKKGRESNQDIKDRLDQPEEELPRIKVINGVPNILKHGKYVPMKKKVNETKISKKKFKELLAEAYYEVLAEAEAPTRDLNWMVSHYVHLEPALIKLHSDDYSDFVTDVKEINKKPTELEVTIRNGGTYILKWVGEDWEIKIRGERHYLGNNSELQDALEDMSYLAQELSMNEPEDEQQETDGDAGFDDLGAGGGADTTGLDTTGDEEEGGADLSGEEIDFEEPEA